MTAAALKPILAKITDSWLFKLGIKVRTIWITYLLGVLSGCLLMFAWVWVITTAPEVAIGLIAQLGGA